MIDIKGEKLYVVQYDNKSIGIMNRIDVETSIHDAEELEDELDFTVLGNFNTADLTGAGLVPFLLIYTNMNATFYEVVCAKDEDDAKERLLGKKRFSGRKAKPEIKRVVNLSNNVTDYYD